MRIRLMVEGQEDVSWEHWVALADACEAHGLEGLFRSDHYLSTVSGSAKPCLDAWATLAALAAQTTRIRLGTLVSPVTFRHPAELAKIALTVDHVSGGRVELGLGAGWNEREHAAFGFPFPATGERMSMVEEQLEVIRAVWTEERASFAGAHYRLDDVPALPKPLQRPHPPLVLGGDAGPRASALAARFADEYNTFSATREQCRERRARLVAACERIGRDPQTLRFSVMDTCLIGTSEADLLDRARRMLELVGLDRDPETYLRDRAATGLVGTVETLVERLRALAAIGVERVYLQHLLHDDLETVALIGREVAPAVAEFASSPAG